jgi:lipopolysaccharide/colanic/teichoic acid biosynthesis glycosyltransferase
MLKNLIDRSLATLGLIVFLPFVLALAWFIRVRLGKPVLFRQIRIGRGEKSFTFLKFRTMSVACDSRGMLLPDEQRLTAFGLSLRASSLDELPQLWNVLKGDMSLVGPRPLLPEYVSRYNTHQRRRHEVKPGITGWAQVNGRNALTWEEKFDLDVWYVDHASILLDLRILCLTLLRVIRPSGISSQGHATMPEFMGVSAETGTRNEQR